MPLPPAPSRATTAFVLAGGGARGAYEVGVLQYLEEELAHELGRPLKPQILCGTSIGALHACHLAAHADRLEHVRFLSDQWKSLRIRDVVDFRWWDVLRLVRESFGRREWTGGAFAREGGLVDPRLLADHIFHAAPWRKIGTNIRQGYLDALAITATHVATGRPTLFLQTRDGRRPLLDPAHRGLRARIGPRHALASAAIPLLFPPVRVGEELYLDGSLRLNVPLSPALKLGARRILVISLRGPRTDAADPLTPDRRSVPNALFLLGKAMNALLLDSTDEDLERLKQINNILEAGVRSYGAGFTRQLNGVLHPHGGPPLRYVHALHVRPSADLAALAAEYLRSPDFRADRAGRVGKTLKDLAQRDPGGVADAASHLLFDGGYAELLMALGRADARALRPEFLRFFSDAPLSPAEDLELPLEPPGTPPLVGAA